MMELENMPPLEYILTSVEENKEFWDKTDIPLGSIHFGHEIFEEDRNSVSIKHTVRLESSIINEENIEFLNIGKSANARRMADMCFGINESRLACLKLQRKGLSIGRVQTPTLGLVVRRDEAIKNHKKEIYFESTVFIEIGEKKIPLQ